MAFWKNFNSNPQYISSVLSFTSLCLRGLLQSYWQMQMQLREETKMGRGLIFFLSIYEPSYGAVSKQKKHINPQLSALQDRGILRANNQQ